jgi:3-phenylpropionate/trans-cinnamate dioxygenase ferredoxin reductase subunit
MKRIVIVGAGQAGGWVAKALRDNGFAGGIVLIGEEAHPPHERPPLSKDVLLGRAPASSTYLFRDDVLRALALDFRPSCRVRAIDLRERAVVLADGGRIAFDRLVLATGGRPAALPVPGGERALSLRSIADAAALRERMLAARRLVIVGGGWIGLEVACAARSLRLDTTIIEAADRLCRRAAHPVLSRCLRDMHAREGVELRLDARIAAIDDEGVRLADGECLPADLVVAGVGMIPNTEVAQAAGLPVDDGILTTANGQTADPGVFACGDVSVYHHPRLGRRVRLESWENAQNQAIACANALLGQPGAEPAAPWFWSDQYGINIQIVGALPIDAAIVTRGDPWAGKGSWHAVVDGRLVGVVALNAARDLRAARQLIEARLKVDGSVLADTSVDLRAFAAAKMP